jgi:hypothetical protein
MLLTFVDLSLILECLAWKSQSYFTTDCLPPNSSSWRQAPLQSPQEISFFQLNYCGNSLYVISSLTRRWGCLLWICLSPRQAYISHLQHVSENSSFYTSHKNSVSIGFRQQIMPILHILCYNGTSVTRTVVSLTTVKFKPLVFSTSGFTLSYTANIFMILDDFSLLPAQFCYIIVYIRKVENCAQIADRCAPWKISNGVQNLVLNVLQF